MMKKKGNTTCGAKGVLSQDEKLGKSKTNDRLCQVIGSGAGLGIP